MRVLKLYLFLVSMSNLYEGEKMSYSVSFIIYNKVCLAFVVDVSQEGQKFRI